MSEWRLSLLERLVTLKMVFPKCFFVQKLIVRHIDATSSYFKSYSFLWKSRGWCGNIYLDWVKRRKSFRIGKFPNSTVTPWSLLFSAVAGNLGKSLRVIYKRAGCTNPIITRTKTPLNNFSALPIGVISHLTTRLEIFQIIYAAIVCEAKSFWHLLGNITNCKGLIPWFPKSNLS